MKKHSYMWKSREVRPLDHEQVPLQGLVGPMSVAVKETTSEMKDRTILRYQAASIVAITKGHSEYTVSGNKLLVSGPSVLIRPAGGDLRHRGVPAHDCTSAYFCFTGPLSRQLAPLAEQAEPYVYIEGDGELYHSLIQCVDIAFSNSWDSAWRLSGMLTDFFLQVAKKIPVLRTGESRVSRRLDVAVEGDWSVARSAEDAANLLGLSRSELYRQFKQEEDCSPADWMRRQRIELAKNHLSDGLNVSEVADLLNFSSPYALSRMFKEVTGQRPKEHKSS